MELRNSLLFKLGGNTKEKGVPKISNLEQWGLHLFKIFHNEVVNLGEVLVVFFGVLIDKRVDRDVSLA